MDSPANSRESHVPQGRLHFYLPDELLKNHQTLLERKSKCRQGLMRKEASLLTRPSEQTTCWPKELHQHDKQIGQLDLGKTYNSIGVSNYDIFQELAEYLTRKRVEPKLVSEIFLGIGFEEEIIPLLRHPHRRNTVCTSFSLDELKLCLHRGLELDLNITVAFNELYPRGKIEAGVLRQIERAINLGVTSLIVSDLDLLAIVRRRWPQIHLTAGVGAGAFNSKAALFLSEMGANRVVFTRKLYGSEMLEIYKHLKDAPVEMEFFAEPTIGCFNHDSCCYLHTWGNTAKTQVQKPPITCAELWKAPGAARQMCRLCSVFHVRLIQHLVCAQEQTASRKVTWKFSTRERANRAQEVTGWINEVSMRIHELWNAPNVIETFAPWSLGATPVCNRCPDNPKELLKSLAEFL